MPLPPTYVFAIQLQSCADSVRTGNGVKGPQEAFHTWHAESLNGHGTGVHQSHGLHLQILVQQFRCDGERLKLGEVHSINVSAYTNRDQHS